MRIHYKKDLIYLALLTLLAINACKKKDNNQQPVQKQAAQTPKATPTPEPSKEKAVYVYGGDKYRDPFIPAGGSSNYQPEAIFDPKRASLKAIISGKTLQSAVLTVSGGTTYFVKNGQIFDVMGKLVKGFTAKVFENKVMIQGEADTTFELKLKNAEKEEKNL